MNENFWKFLALGAATVYMFKIAKRNAIPGGVTINGDKLVDTVMGSLPIQNQITKNILKKSAKALMKNYVNQRHAGSLT